MLDERRSAPAVALTPEIMAYLERAGVEVAGGAGDVLVRRGEPGHAFWVVLEGIVEVRLTGEDGVSLPLARLGTGATFGEMALITGDPVSADVVALAPVRLLRYPAEHFARALGECEPLRALVMARMAANLRGTSTDVWNFFQRARALNVLMGPRGEVGPLVAETGVMRPVREAIARLAPAVAPVLISGDAGTGKSFVAGKMHEAGARGTEAPFVAVDCRSLDPADAERFLFGAPGALPATGEDPGALRRYGALQLAHGGMLVLRHVEALPPAAREAIGRYAATRREGLPAYPATRLVATTTLAPPAFAAAAPELAPAFGADTLILPRLQERRRDILPLARLFLEKAARGEPKHLGNSAEHALLSQRYAHRNVAELHDAVGMAVLISDGPEIAAEHIFTGPKGRGTVREIDVSRFSAVQRLTSPRLLAWVRAAIFTLFSAITVTSLTVPETRAGTVANALTWGLWEPALFVVFLFMGRLWCTVCPLSTAGRLASRLHCFGRSPGPWLKSHSGWFIIGGFFLILWSEHAFHMTSRPRAAGMLLAALFAAAIASAVIWRREAWCRYLCPLGNCGAIYALPAVLTVHSNPSVCATMCTTHECFKGSQSVPGCPVFHHPLYANEAHACKQCWQCLRVCPHGSARLWLRLPLQSVWAQPDVSGALVPFALFLFFFAPAMLASQGRGWAATLSGFTTTGLLSVGAAVVAARWLGRALAADRDGEPTLSTRLALSLVVLAWGPAMAYQFGNIDTLASLHLHAEPGSLLATVLPRGGLSLLPVAQVAVALTAGVFAAACVAGVRGALHRAGRPYPLTAWRAILLICALYEVAVLALVVVA